MKTWDAIVIGGGGIGSAAVFHLATRGLRVLGIDRFPGAHDRGTSHGHTRMIRQAYCEHPDYVPLVRRAYDLWEDLQQVTRQQLYHEVGLLEVGPADGMVVPGVLQSAEEHDLEVESLDRSDVRRRFPGFHVPEPLVAVFERRAGFLLVEPCVAAYQTVATDGGAEFRTGEVQGWEVRPREIVVKVDGQSLVAGRLIVAAGPWARDLMLDTGVPLKVVRKPQNWFANHDDRYQANQGCPGFLFEVPGGIFYGFPQFEGRGVKVGEHTGGIEIRDLANIDRSVDEKQRSLVRRFLAEYLPGVSGPASDHSLCMYTNSPDGHFVVDRHPANERICFAMGLSGHGFKFAPVLGEALADLAVHGRTELPIGFLGCDRFRS